MFQHDSMDNKILCKGSLFSLLVCNNELWNKHIIWGGSTCICNPHSLGNVINFVLNVGIPKDKTSIKPNG